MGIRAAQWSEALVRGEYHLRAVRRVSVLRTSVPRGNENVARMRSTLAAASAPAVRPRTRSMDDVRRHGVVPRRLVEPARLPPAVVVVLVLDARQPVRRGPVTPRPVLVRHVA